MAKAQHFKQASDFKFQPHETTELEGLGEIPSRDYSALSSALQKKGEFSLLQGDDSGLKFFDMAIKLDPSNGNLLFDQALALFEYGSEVGKEKALSLACKRLKQSVKLNPESFETWHAWGNTLFLLGIRKKHSSYFLSAKKKYEKAAQLSSTKPDDILADLYWDMGDLWMKLGEISQEAAELSRSLTAYERATTYQEHFPAEFWNNFGDVYFKLGQKTNDLRLYVKAVSCYKKAISSSISSPDAWLKLGQALQEIYSYTHDEDHFSQANECNAAGAQLCPSHETLWSDWAHLLLENGQHFRDIKKLRSAIEKCQRGIQCNPKNIHLIGIWSEALSCIGFLSEKLEPLHEALNKLEDLTERVTDDPNILYSYGMCLMATAAYFNDCDYYYQAIEKFQEGLSLDRSNPRLWFGMGAAHIAAATLDQDEKNYDRACRFFERTLKLKVTSTIHVNYATCLLKYAEFLHSNEMIELALYHFEQAIGMQKNVAYLHPEWLFQYATALDFFGEFAESEEPYAKAIELLNHILMLRPEFPQIHTRMALVYSHFAELINEPEMYQRAFHHYRIAHQREKENDQIILDWAITLVNLGELVENTVDSEHYFRDAEYKMIKAARLGNTHAYFSLACLYCLQEDHHRCIYFLEKALSFDSLPPIEDLLEDEWLESIHETPAFQAFVEQAMVKLESESPE